MQLRIALGGLDGGTRVDEKKTGHGEGGERGSYCAGVDVEAAGFGRHCCILFTIGLCFIEGISKLAGLGGS